MEGRSKKVRIVNFHVGVHMSAARVTMHVQLGMDGVDSIDLLENGVYIRAKGKMADFHTFVPFSNITRVDLDPAYVPENALAKSVTKKSDG